MKAKLNIWTIGHSTRTLPEFLELLESNEIRILADVRRFPSSRKYPHFNQVSLPSPLADAGVEYLYIPELGGRRRPNPDSINTAWRNESFRGYADHMETEEFKAGIEKLRAEASRARVAVMCSEAVWWRCHRALIADYLKSSGSVVHHILGPGKVQIHPYTSAAHVTGGKLDYSE